MKLHVCGTAYEGRVVDLRCQPVDGATVAAAIRGTWPLPAVDAPAAGPVYDYCGHVHPSMGLRTKTALAAAARSRGHETAHDDTIAELRERLADLDRAEPTLPSARESVDDATVAELRESAATARGRLEARETLGAETAEIRAEVRETTRTLAKRETERTAARQSRQQRRDRAREYRDRQARRRRLADRLANRRRDARRDLVDAVAENFVAALEAVPGPPAADRPDDPGDVPPVPAALAVLRLARTDAPVVVATDRFATPTAAADWLSAPVVRC
ncbi:hypothetical protein [Haloarcula salinisoli]|uniref:Uncharacterized protein n=1 Tax=Haloarcula salinisoli TaxID=2487746 RepID=A0A8J8CBC6_9EURY|nr:hypothetical protein [Halomicroarcula salinisoli]MBX0286866.1 hypothetical protein [Halomicroarcula salinisoli]MBX0304168.1 hypothetical protein [Halomicroarcula salinisoli]